MANGTRIADPFLLAHQVAPRMFDLSGKLDPISIRDQMIRGVLLVHRASRRNSSVRSLRCW